jgi:hypothetical protein
VQRSAHDTNAKLPKPILLVLGVVHLLVTTATWRDLARRPADQIRGPKALWRAVSAANTGGSIAYLVVGRKSAARRAVA